MIFKTFKFLLLFGSLLFFPIEGNAQSKYSNEFLDIGVGSRALGMGGAYVALSRDVSAGYWNPAGLTTISRPEIMLMHASHFAGIVNYDYAGFGKSFGDQQAFAISMIRLGIDDIPITDVPNPEQNVGSDNRPFVSNYVSNSEYALFLSYAKQKSERFSYGGNIKLIQRGYTSDAGSALGLGFDIGFIYDPSNFLRFGLNITDVTSTLVAWNTGHKELALPTVKFGTAIELQFSFGQILPVFGIDTRFEGREYATAKSIGLVSFDFRVGLEYSYQNLIAFRAGIDDIGQPTAGTGVQWSNYNFDYSFGAFNSVDELGNSHRISLQYRFGE